MLPTFMFFSNPLRRSLAALILGASMIGAMPPWNIWPLLIPGFSLFYQLLNKVETRRGALLYGWLFGFGYHVAGLWWIANALLVPGSPFKWVWPLTILGLPWLLAWFSGLAAVLCVRFRRARLAGYFSFIAAFGISEWLRGHAFSGFPWNTFAYTWSGWLAMAQVTALGGAYFLTVLTIAWATLPGFLWLWPAHRRMKVSAAVLAIAIFAVCAIYGQARLAANPTQLDHSINIRVVQANISQEDKWDPEKASENLQRELALSGPAPNEPAGTTILVWPETALDQDETHNADVRGALKTVLGQYRGNAYLMTGLLRWVGDAPEPVKYYNSFVAFDRDLHPVASYDKSHLVPFGEYIPLQNILPMHAFVHMDGLTPGTGLVTAQVKGLPDFTPLVCYEVIFPGAVSGSPRPRWLVNITNDAWYGDSPGPRQHFAQTRFRAIEEGLPVVRAAETGISGIIDPLGRIIVLAPLQVASAPEAALPLPLSPTPYDHWHDWPFFILIALLALSARFLIHKDILHTLV